MLKAVDGQCACRRLLIDSISEPMDLFKPLVPEARQHPIFKMMLSDQYGPERAVLQQWAEGFVDRDGKFVQEFPLSFESSLWELYLHAALKSWKIPVDFSHHAPDFVLEGAFPFALEATIAAPAAGGKPAYGYSAEDIPDDFTQFNIDATLRICNSFAGKVKRLREYYVNLPHMAGRPFVIGIASFVGRWPTCRAQGLSSLHYLACTTNVSVSTGDTSCSHWLT